MTDADLPLSSSSQAAPRQDWAQAPVRSLAYMGDVVYEMHVRERTVRGGGNVNALHRATVSQVSAIGQAGLAKRMLSLYRPEELAIFKRARNHKTQSPRRVSGHDYQLSTAFEAVLGYLYLKPDRARLAEILALTDAFLEEDTHAEAPRPQG